MDSKDVRYLKFKVLQLKMQWIIGFYLKVGLHQEMEASHYGAQKNFMIISNKQVCKDKEVSGQLTLYFQ